MKVGSLFSGYGGLDLAVGGQLAWYSEIEPAACTVMEGHHPGVPNLGDITAVDWAEVEPVDVITGGYPCQPFSNAGKRKGTNDERHLWPYVRDALSAIRPTYAVLENVRGHLTLGFDVVLADLADLGWSARWGVVRAADAGAPHNRARLFIVAYPESKGLQGRESAATLAEGGLAGRCPVGKSAGEVADPEGAERRTAQPDDLQARGAAELGQRAGTPTNPGSKRHGSGQGSRSLAGVGGPSEGSRRQASTARQKPGAGSAQDVADADRSGAWLHGSLSGRERSASEPSGPAVLRPQDGTFSADRPTPSDANNWGDYAPAITRWQRVIGRPAPAPTVRRRERDRLNPAFVEWMMGLPEGWVTGHGLSASQELKMLGNGVVPQQARLALELLGGVA